VHVRDSFGIRIAMRGEDDRSEAFFSYIPVREADSGGSSAPGDPHIDRRSADGIVAGL
jgi:hypothetical protein